MKNANTINFSCPIERKRQSLFVTVYHIRVNKAMRLTGFDITFWTRDCLPKILPSRYCRMPIFHFRAMQVPWWIQVEQIVRYVAAGGASLSLTQPRHIRTAFIQSLQRLDQWPIASTWASRYESMQHQGRVEKDLTCARKHSQNTLTT